MLTNHLIGVWLLTATWLGPQQQPLSEPYEVRTYESHVQCAAAVDSLVDELLADKASLKTLLSLFPDSTAIKLECVKQAQEM